MIKAIIFDFDGLILNTEMTEYLSWKELYAAFGVPFPQVVWLQQIGTVGFDPFVLLETQAGRALDRPAEEVKRRQRDQELLAQEMILPGVESYLAQARELGLRIGLASSSRHAWVDEHLQRLGLWQCFDIITCRDDVADRPKPDPAVYRLALARLGVAPAEALALEDSPNGIAAAKAAGVWVTAVPNTITHTLDFAQAHYRLRSLADMPLRQLITRILPDKDGQ